MRHASLNFPGPKIANNKASASYIACCEGHTDIARILINSQQFDIKNYKGYSPLYAACRKLHIDIIKLLMEQPNIDVNDGSYSICFLQEMKMLFLNHEKLNVNKLLIQAITDRDLPMLEKILAHPNINPNACNYFKRPALMVAFDAEKRKKVGMFHAIIQHPKTNPKAGSVYITKRSFTNVFLIHHIPMLLVIIRIKY